MKVTRSLLGLGLAPHIDPLISYRPSYLISTLLSQGGTATLLLLECLLGASIHAITNLPFLDGSAMLPVSHDGGSLKGRSQEALLTGFGAIDRVPTTAYIENLTLYLSSYPNSKSDPLSNHLTNNP